MKFEMLHMEAANDSVLLLQLETPQVYIRVDLWFSEPSKMLWSGLGFTAFQMTCHHVANASYVIFQNILF